MRGPPRVQLEGTLSIFILSYLLASCCNHPDPIPMQLPGLCARQFEDDSYWEALQTQQIVTESLTSCTKATQVQIVPESGWQLEKPDAEQGDGLQSDRCQVFQAGSVRERSRFRCWQKRGRLHLGALRTVRAGLPGGVVRLRTCRSAVHGRPAFSAFVLLCAGPPGRISHPATGRPGGCHQPHPGLLTKSSDRAPRHTYTWQAGIASKQMRNSPSHALAPTPACERERRERAANPKGGGVTDRRIRGQWR